MEQSTRRSIYIVTMWPERLASTGEPAVWRFSVENARTGKRYGFADLKQVMAFLNQQMKGSE